MKKYAIKLVITKTFNNDRKIEWFFFNTDEEKQHLIDEKKQEENNWNYHTPTAISKRIYNFKEYLTADLMETDISELEGLTLRYLIELIKNHL